MVSDEGSICIAIMSNVHFVIAIVNQETVGVGVVLRSGRTHRRRREKEKDIILSARLGRKIRSKDTSTIVCTRMYGLPPKK